MSWWRAVETTDSGAAPAAPYEATSGGGVGLATRSVAPAPAPVVEPDPALEPTPTDAPATSSSGPAGLPDPVVAPVPVQAHAPVEATTPSTGMPDRPEDWGTRSRVVGGLVEPVLHELADEIPSLRSVLFCTVDGHNLCTLGVDADDVGRLTALTSTLFGVAGTHRAVLGPRGTEPMTLHVSTGEDHTALFGLEVPGVGAFVLGAHAQDVRLGTLLVHVRRTAQRIGVLLETAEHDPAPPPRHADS